MQVREPSGRAQRAASRRPDRGVLLGLGALLLLVARLAAGLTVEGPADQARRLALDELLASQSAWQTNDRQYREERDAGHLSRAAAEEFAAFVAGLRRALLAECERYRTLGGDPAEHGVDCGAMREAQEAADSEAAPSESSAGAGGRRSKATESRRTGSGSGPGTPEPRPAGGPAMTEDESVAGLDGELRRIESDLDDVLRTARDELSRRDAARADPARPGRIGGGAYDAGGWTDPGAGQGGSASTSRPGQAEGVEPGEPGGATPEGMEGAAGEGRDARSPGSGRAAGRSERSVSVGSADGRPAPQRDRTPAGGDDDDALARQLREAAEAETDPVLREKLWEEYRKYKSST